MYCAHKNYFKSRRRTSCLHTCRENQYCYITYFSFLYFNSNLFIEERWTAKCNYCRERRFISSRWINYSSRLQANIYSSIYEILCLTNYWNRIFAVDGFVAWLYEKINVFGLRLLDLYCFFRTKNRNSNVWR